MTATKDLSTTDSSTADSSTSTQESGHAPSTRPRLNLSATQLVASALAAVTATTAASYLGVSGTVIGAAVASMVTVTGNAVYGQSLRRTGERVRTAVPLVARWPAPDATRAAAPAATSTSTSVLPSVQAVPPIGGAPRHRAPAWQRLALATVAVFVAILAAVTVVELVAGRPLSDLLRGKQVQGTTLGGTSGAGSDRTPGPARVTVTVTPSVVLTTPTITQTAPPVTATLTPTVTPSATATPSATPSGTPSATTSPTSGGSTSAPPSSSPTP